MSHSSYQIERTLNRLLTWLGASTTAQTPADEGVRVEVSGREEGGGPSTVRSAEEGETPRAAFTRIDVLDSTPRPPAVEQELERRAGSFMTPPYPEPPTPFSVPKLRPRTRPLQQPDGKDAEGD